MQTRQSIPTDGTERIQLAKKCLALISRIAARGACSQNPAHIGYALQELTQVLLERTGCEGSSNPSQPTRFSICNGCTRNSTLSRRPR